MSKCICFAVLALALVGCGRSTPTNYYLLESGIEAMQVESLPKRTLRVAQVQTPGYLQRNNIVSRVQGQNKLILAEFHLWAEPLNNGVRRVIEETLLEPLVGNGINVLPPATEERGDFTLLLDVQRFDGNFQEKAALESWWTLVNRDDKPIARGMYTATEKVNGTTYDELVKVQSDLLRNFGLYLAKKLPPHITGRK